MRPFDWHHLDVRRAAREAFDHTEEGVTTALPRLREAEMPGSPPGRMAWRVQAEERHRPGGPAVPWLHLHIEAQLTLQCQRCLGPLAVPLTADASYRFVPTEAQAEAEDAEAEEDVLALDAPLDVPALVEDECLMELPLVPRHVACALPAEMAARAAEVPAEAPAAHPFAVLGALKRRPEGGDAGG